LFGVHVQGGEQVAHAFATPVGGTQTAPDILEDMSVSDVASVVAAGGSLVACGISWRVARMQRKQKADLAQQKWIREQLTDAYRQIYSAVETYIGSCRRGEPDFKVLEAVGDTLDSFIPSVPDSLGLMAAALRTQAIVVDFYFLSPENVGMHKLLGESTKEATDNLNDC
jgi:hypothetical protein